MCVVWDVIELLSQVSEDNATSIKLIDENLATVTKTKLNITWDKPTIVGAVVLDLAKHFMYDFQYNVLKNIFNVHSYTPILAPLLMKSRDMLYIGTLKVGSM